MLVHRDLVLLFQLLIFPQTFNVLTQLGSHTMDLNFDKRKFKTVLPICMECRERGGNLIVQRPYAGEEKLSTQRNPTKSSGP